MRRKSIRVIIDKPAPLYGKLRKQAARQDRSIEGLILASVCTIPLTEMPQEENRMHFPLIVSDGPKVDLNNEDIYENVVFP
jgi:hypothetical protein